MKMTNTLTQRWKRNQTHVSICSCNQSSSLSQDSGIGPSLTTNSLLLLQNNQRIFWMELLGITMETISHIYKSGANFLCKSHAGSKGTNLCRTMRTARLIKYETLEINFSPTPGCHTLAEAHSFLCLSKLRSKNQTNPA